MADHIIQTGENFWNIRGTFRIGGVVNIGTQASLVKLASGKFVLLDAYTLQGAVKQQVMDLTDNGALVEAIINLHPFHTVHCKKSAAQFPTAKLYGSDRHAKKFPKLAWEDTREDSHEFAALYADDFDFSVPDGVDFISQNENVHFSSVLAYHRASQTIHVDDTLMYMDLPAPLGLLVPKRLGFHPTLGQALQRREGAAQEFREWAVQIAHNWGDARHVCAAHMGTLEQADDVGRQIYAAQTRAEKTLIAHERKYGR